MQPLAYALAAGFVVGLIWLCRRPEPQPCRVTAYPEPPAPTPPRTVPRYLSYGASVN